MKRPFDNDRLVDYLLGQLDPDEARAVEREAAASPEIAARLEAERRSLGDVRRRLTPTPAPPGLETRIRAALADEAAASGAGPARRPFGAWVLAVGGLAAGIVIGLVSAQGLAGPEGSLTPADGVELVVVDDVCDRNGVPVERQVDCDDPQHFNSLRTAEGAHWQVASIDATGRQLLGERSLRAHRVRVWGQYHEAVQTVRVDRFEDLGAPALVASHSRLALLAHF